VKIISMSFGLKSRNDLIDDCIADANKAKTVLFAAASNNGNRRSVSYPAREELVICMNASNGNGKPAPFTPPTRSLQRNFSILGTNVESTWPAIPDTEPDALQKNATQSNATLEGNSKYMSGTSVSTPIAAALTAALFAYSLANVGGTVHSELARYRGVLTLFEEMSVKTDGYDDIVPWAGRRSQFRSYREGRKLANVLEHIIELI
jgi:subtilisin family serine protease